MDRADGFTLRQALPWRIAPAVVLPAWIVLMGFIFFGEAERPPPAFLVIGGLMVVYAVTMTIRYTRLAVVADGEELIVRGLWGTQRIPRSDITGFSTGRYQRIGYRTAYADRRSGRAVRLMALEPPAGGARREQEIQPKLDRLEAWRTGAPAVHG